ncbi:MAG TPA: NF038122 family metalloprotease [Fimbriimonadaceae bacterium]|nr:NF038122 family metalloprotease [Fimbriimonadaceae bacterium]
MKRSCLISGRIRGVAVLAVAAALGLTTAQANLTINPTYDSSITSDPNAAAIESCLNQVCAFYNASFTDSITVNVTFHNATSGLGSNNPAKVTIPYATFRTALAADATTGNDAIAVASLPSQANNPVDGSTDVVLTKPNARALGITADATVDDVINLNTSLCFLNHTSPVSGKYDLYAVACHEMDECLGTPSGLSFSAGTPWSADMFRYDEFGSRTYTTATNHHAYFSLDGTTNIVEYNQFNRSNGGDWGDWIVHNPAQVQDWAGSTGRTIDMGPSETTLLDAVGYNFAPVPEPASFAVLGLGALALIRLRRKA